jgi:myosin-5
MGFGAASSFHYLNQGTCVIDGIDDGNEIQSTLEALGHMGFTASELADLFRILASILLLGNITFEAGEQENESKVSNPPQLARAAEALRVTPEALSEALVARLIETKNENTRVALSPDRARSSRDAIAKNMYKELFSWLIGRVNIRVAKDPVIAAADTKANSVDMSLGLLDIFGFEVFDFNSLEQFFINYANEKLQQHFNQHTFQREQKLYTDEGITVPQAAYQDNDVCLALIENNKSPPGILRMMNEEVAKPSGSDDNL